jgi:hypothetical protein
VIADWAARRVKAGLIRPFHDRFPTKRGRDGSIYVQGPASVLDRFVAYVNELKSGRLLWEVLDKPLSEKGT